MKQLSSLPPDVPKLLPAIAAKTLSDLPEELISGLPDYTLEMSLKVFMDLNLAARFSVGDRFAAIKRKIMDLNSEKKEEQIKVATAILWRLVHGEDLKLGLKMPPNSKPMNIKLLKNGHQLTIFDADKTDVVDVRPGQDEYLEEDILKPFKNENSLETVIIDEQEEMIEHQFNGDDQDEGEAGTPNAFDAQSKDNTSDNQLTINPPEANISFPIESLPLASLLNGK